VLSGDDNLKAEGQADETTGKVEVAIGEVERKVVRPSRASAP
jgi:uncharacterized protein YjbJ (UPF0337 family)